MLTAQQFERARRLALGLAGIEMVERHRDLLWRRSCRAGVSDEASLDALLAEAERGDVPACRRLIGLVTIKHTGFFRHPSHFAAAAEHSLRAARQGGTARLWSAAVATGEEAYSLAMAILEVFPPSPPVSILATDVDEDALSAARAGVYDKAALLSLGPGRQARFFSQPAAGTRFQVARELRGLVEFRALNLADPIWGLAGPLDVVFCRNVLMYLESSQRHSILQRLAALLDPDGLLILDPSEHLGKASDLFSARANGIYSLRPSSFPGTRAVRVAG